MRRRCRVTNCPPTTPRKVITTHRFRQIAPKASIIAGVGDDFDRAGDIGKCHLRVFVQQVRGQRKDDFATVVGFEFAVAVPGVDDSEGGGLGLGEGQAEAGNGSALLSGGIDMTWPMATAISRANLRPNRSVGKPLSCGLLSHIGALGGDLPAAVPCQRPQVFQFC